MTAGPLVGILGGGQLGQMMAQAGAPLGCRFRFFDPDPNACAAHFGEHICAPFDDPAAIDRFCDALDFATYEFENVPAPTVAHVASHTTLRPAVRSIELTQDRLTEKQFIESTGAHCAPYRNVTDLPAAIADLGLPAILKTRRFGYDGKGQLLIRSDADFPAAHQIRADADCVLESLVKFVREISVVVVRSHTGDTIAYPPTENIHRGGILRTSTAPSAGGRTDEAVRIAISLAEAMDHVGAMCVEFFETADGLIVNEIAPRVHNSGHWTIDGAVTSQFENHIRAVIGKPLGSTATSAPSVMLNLVGDAPTTEAVAAIDPAAFLHLYGKSPRRSRKIGHLTIVGEDLPTRTRRLANLPGVDTPSALCAADRLTVS